MNRLTRKAHQSNNYDLGKNGSVYQSSISIENSKKQTDEEKTSKSLDI